MTRKHWSAVFALALTVLFLGLATRNVDLGQLWVALAQARLAWLPLFVLIGLVDFLIRAARWRLLLATAKPRAPLWLLFRLEAIGLSINNVLFMRMGELARAFLASRELGVPLATTLASVAVERALDVAALLSLFSAAAAMAPDLVPRALAHLALLGLMGIFGALIVLVAAEGPLSPGGWAEKALKRWPRVHDLALQLATGASVLRRPWAGLAAAALSVALWGIDAVFYWAGARALGLGGVLDYWRSVLVLSWAGAGAALPAAPGAFGAFEAMVRKIMVSFGVPAPQALAYAVFTHLVGYAQTTVLGLIFLYSVGLSLGELHSVVQTMDRGAKDGA